MSGLLKFSYRVGNADHETKLQEAEIQRQLAEKESLMYRRAFLSEKQKNKPPTPLPYNEYCEKMAELKRVVKAFEKQECDVSSQIVGNAFCKDFGGYEEYEMAKKIIRLKRIVSEYNLLQCELIQKGCDVSSAPAQINACCDALMQAAEGKDVSMDTYVVLNQCYPVQC